MQQPTYGGQAVIEGVMMRGRQALAVAVRAPDGRIVCHVEPMRGWSRRGAIARWPLARGVALLADTLHLGMRALLFSAGVAAGQPASLAPTGAVWASLAFSLSLAVGLLFLVPALAVGLAAPWLGAGLVSILIEGGLRLALLVVYLLSIGRRPEVRRLFGYHGAEHQTINAHEAGAALTPAAVRAFPLTHPRCGTGFLLVVTVVATVVFLLLGPLDLPARLASRVLLLPLVAALAYEYIRLTALVYRHPVGRWLAAPSLALQRLTTRPPDEAMLAVAIAALRQVLAHEAAPARPTREPGLGQTSLSMSDG
jgi:uncharacterized protein YqhQ